MESYQSKPFNKPIRKVLFFDVETSGLETKKSIKECAHIIQLSYMIFDIETNQISEWYNQYINISPDVVIPPIVEEITGITRTICDQKGVPIKDALYAFYKAMHRCDFVVSHNFYFDSTLIKIEFVRHPELKITCPNGVRLFHKEHMDELGVDRYCTMRSSTDLCKLPFPPRKDGKPESPIKEGEKPNYKFPKLEELYQHLFPQHKKIDGFHNSMVDVIVCFKCFMKLYYVHEITEEQIKNMLEIVL